MKKRICVAKYKEDTNWVRNLKEFEIIVYNKNNDIDIDEYNIKSEPYFIDDIKHIDIPNIGREAHTYLYHIVNNYDNLYDYEVFTQGDPFDHTNGTFVSKISSTLNNGYNHLSCYTKNQYLSDYLDIGKLDNDGKPIRENYNYYGHINELNKELFGKNIPDEYTIGLHALFYCDKETLLKNTFETYIKCFEKFNVIKYQINKGGGNGVIGKPNGENFPYVFEYYWDLLFRKEIN
jgi:hypothetical protein